jgi:prolyl oligopeptidase
MACVVNWFICLLLGCSVVVLFAPEERVSLASYFYTNAFVVLTLLDNVKSKISLWRFNQVAKCQSDAWKYVGSEPTAVVRGISASAVDVHTSNSIWLTVSSFLQASTLLLVDLDKNVNNAEGNKFQAIDVLGEAFAELAVARTATPAVGTCSADGLNDFQFILKRLPDQFLAANYVEFQREAISKDGTSVPYFIVHHRDMAMCGSNPTLLYGYGGFGNSDEHWYVFSILLLILLL